MDRWKVSSDWDDYDIKTNATLKQEYNTSFKFKDRILDNVHGYIELTGVERDIIDLPVFSRLQSIKQLSLVNWVFPGAEHTRYIHSLGVMYLADQMAIQLGFNQPADRQMIRLAALLHDIGHFPLSPSFVANKYI